MIRGTEHFIRFLAHEAGITEQEAEFVHKAYTASIRRALEGGLRVPFKGTGAIWGRFVPPGRVRKNTLPTVPTDVFVRPGYVRVYFKLENRAGAQLFQDSPLSDVYVIGEECGEE